MRLRPRRDDIRKYLRATEAVRRRPQLVSRQWVHGDHDLGAAPARRHHPALHDLSLSSEGSRSPGRAWVRHRLDPIPMTSDDPWGCPAHGDHHYGDASPQSPPTTPPDVIEGQPRAGLGAAREPVGVTSGSTSGWTSSGAITAFDDPPGVLEGQTAPRAGLGAEPSHRHREVPPGGRAGSSRSSKSSQPLSDVLACPTVMTGRVPSYAIA